jgi:CheY-like chemotaxis protein
MDWQMPVLMDGIDARKEIQHKGFNMATAPPIVGLTASIQGLVRLSNKAWQNRLMMMVPASKSWTNVADFSIFSIYDTIMAVGPVLNPYEGTGMEIQL